MKRILAFVLVLVCACVFQTAKAQELKFEKTEHDFGKIKENGGKVVCEFKFKNAGNSPLIILKTYTTCTCAKITYPKKPIAVKQEGVITVEYDPKRQNGTFYKTIQINSNDPKKRAIISIKGAVE